MNPSMAALGLHLRYKDLVRGSRVLRLFREFGLTEIKVPLIFLHLSGIRRCIPILTLDHQVYQNGIQIIRRHKLSKEGTVRAPTANKDNFSTNLLLSILLWA
jgi:hypothetical protein